MREPARSFAAALVAAALLLGPVASAFAATFDDEGLEATEKETPIVLDALVLRPVGLVMTAVGTALFVPAAAAVGVTRPTDVGQPFQVLVANPFRYTFIDPIGQHSSPRRRPDTSRAPPSPPQPRAPPRARRPRRRLSPSPPASFPAPRGRPLRRLRLLLSSARGGRDGRLAARGSVRVCPAAPAHGRAARGGRPPGPPRPPGAPR